MLACVRVPSPAHQSSLDRDHPRRRKNPPPTLKDQDSWSPAFHAFLRRALVKRPEPRASIDELLLEPFAAELGRGAQQSGELVPLLKAELMVLLRE